ncbi:MAG: NADH:flavin oxidoreductase, partial [Bacillota bacterium]|nr:NADH:flavin oxidoreductase [Bacillota bacterium]
MDIFKEANIAGIKLKNRIIRSATHERIAIPNEELKNIYINLAMGGVGAIVTGFAGVHRFGKTSTNMPMFNSAEDCSKWESIINEMKKYNTPIILQLGHGGGKNNPVIIGRNALSPSSYQYNKGQKSDEMSTEDIREVIESYAISIQKAKEVGFDGVQIQASHGYLLSEFLSPRLNQRVDNWGGSTEKRFKIIKEIFYEARKRVGSYPIIVKITAYDTDEGGTRID